MLSEKLFTRVCTVTSRYSFRNRAAVLLVPCGCIMFCFSRQSHCISLGCLPYLALVAYPISCQQPGKARFAHTLICCMLYVAGHLGGPIRTCSLGRTLRKLRLSSNYHSTTVPALAVTVLLSSTPPSPTVPAMRACLGTQLRPCRTALAQTRLLCQPI